MPTTIFTLNGVLDHNAPERPSEVLRRLSRGPYTVGVAAAHHQLPSYWEEHCLRLAHGLFRLTEVDGSFQDACNWLQELTQRLCTPRHVALAEALVPGVSRAVQLSRLNAGDLSGRVVTILLCKPQESQCHPGGLPVALAVHVMPLKIPQPSRAVHVAVVGPPRRLPDVKDSQWATDRLPLELQLPDDAAEGVLCSSGGKLLEGLITNLFVVIDGDSGPELRTAGVDEGVLPGIMRGRVIRVCGKLGIHCEEKAPRLMDWQQWEEVFLTNTVRGIQAVQSILLDSTAPVLVASAPGSITRQLQLAIAREPL